MRFPNRAALTAFFLITVFACVPARAADWLLAAPSPHVVPGEAFEVVVIGPPPAGGWPKHLTVMVAPANSPLPISVELAAANQPSPSQQRYMGQWPGEITGFATLALEGAAQAQLLFEAAAPKLATDEPPNAAPEKPLATALPDEPSPKANDKITPTALGFQEPIYFLFGGQKPKSARYQISFRYRLFDDSGVIAERLPFVRGLYFGYTQTSLWDLESDSKPFRDTSFRPSLFYRWQITDTPQGNSLALAGGFEHESNGRDGDNSRSIDTLFVRADIRYRLSENGLYLGIEPKLWYYTNKDENPDIPRYRGYGHLGLRIGSDAGLMLTTTLRKGTSRAGSAQFDLSYPIQRSMFSGVGTFIHLQYFNGYGETLLDYNKKHRSQWRIGISAVR
ncbi:MAG: phospholipase A [Azoarcus sp.]|jgi:outer membrane phospholipase A|nr:phospholipase A [Azoarcus sp.]